MARRCVFISYARTDGPRVQQDAALLRAGGVRVFIDVHDIEAGAQWEAALESALAQCERVMVFWSAAARASSWVDREWRTALRLGKRLVPALLDDTPLPSELAVFQGLSRSAGPAFSALSSPKATVAAVFGTVMLAAVLGWGVQKTGTVPPPLPLPPIAAVEVPRPSRSASDAAAAMAAVDGLQAQARSLHDVIAAAADTDASVQALREGRQQLQAALHQLPFAAMVLEDVLRLKAVADGLGTAAKARAAQFSEGSATAEELRALHSLLQSQSSIKTSHPPPVEAASESGAQVLLIIGIAAVLAMLALVLLGQWHKRRYARALVNAVFLR